MSIENDDVAAQLLGFLERMYAFVAMLAAWATGAAGGGPNGDGRYPLPTGPGTTTLVPSPLQSRYDMSSLDVVRIALTSGSTIVLGPEHNGKTIVCAGVSATSNINVQVPGNVAPNWCVLLIQEGTGGPRVTVTIGTNGAGEPGFLRSFGNAFRLAGENAEACVKCIARDSAFRSRMLVSGNVVQ
ncbi:hypothetical protein [Sphingomonas sp. IW22]|uniref:hypothetical protein n=1 Tax=Sphingomonas sp. IW22 TaxID=3242489 RepID=UPI0035220CDD